MEDYKRFYEPYSKKDGSVFVTIPQPERYHEYTFEELMEFEGNELPKINLFDPNGSFTMFIKPSRNVMKLGNGAQITARLRDFIYRHKNLFDVEDKHALYHSFSIPKRTRGFRTINAPNPELMAAFYELVAILNSSRFVPYHTSAFAYVQGRSTVDAAKKHQANRSNWFGHFDFHDFFGSTTLDFVMDMLGRIYPFSEIIERGNGDVLRTALSLGFLDGGLPQGTPLSPFLTNLMMIPFDHIVAAALRKFPNRNSRSGTDRFVYTRYADDIHISCFVEFDVKEIERFIVEVLHSLNAPFSLNQEKTHYNSRAGKNYMLGVIINKDNEITVGHKTKDLIKVAVHNYMMDRKNKISWELHDLQVLSGKLAYIKGIEPEWTKTFVKANAEKFGVDLFSALQEDMAG